jgi:CRISPR/Cas system-associated exonuclease Cas4 (RecB family)
MMQEQRPVSPALDRRQSAAEHLSYSAIALYQSCPLRYYFRYVLGLPEQIVAASLVFGAAFHASLQFHFEQLLAGNPPPALDTLLGAFQHAWHQHDGQTIEFAKGEDINSVGRLADRMLSAFQASSFARPEGTILGVEEELRGQVIPDCPPLVARVDLIVETADALVVTDFKTSRRGWGPAHVSDASPQLLLYSELANSLADGKALRLEFAVMTKAESPSLTLHPVEPDPQQIERTKRIVERVWKSIRAGHLYPSPSPIQCPTCPFREACRAWVG